MKLLVEMNLSPSWVERLARRGLETVHWSSILAASSELAPSVVQLRMQDLLSERALEAIVSTVHAHATEIALSALISIADGGAHGRILPLRQP